MRTYFSSYYLLEIVSAEPINFIGALSAKGITVRDVVQIDELRLQFKVNRKHKNLVLKEAERSGCQCNVINVIGFAGFLENAKKRMALILGLLLLAFLTLYIPTRILYFSVEGLEQLNSAYILDNAERVGLTFGASRKEVRSERVKNALLEAVPELKWVGINTYGCRAVISVKERSIDSQLQANRALVQGVFSTNDGIISSITVTKGTPLCKPGQAVTTGQLLISGYTDCGLVLRGEGAEGEVRAITNRKIVGAYPVMEAQSPNESEVSRKWSIQIGKKRIKLYIDSGNLDTKCGRMVQEYRLKLPGGFCLPLSLVKDTIVSYEYISDTPFVQEETLSDLAAKYVQENMVAGVIRSSQMTMHTDDYLCRFFGTYLCDEMIGKIQNEGLENLDDRTNR